jgi:(2Fe-2S) ferredoxin
MTIPPYQYHLFFCLNTRTDGRKSCGGYSESLYHYAKERIRALGLKPQVRVSQSGCLGRCQVGPSLVIYPEGVWYQVTSIDIVEEIIQEHILGGKKLEKWLMEGFD